MKGGAWANISDDAKDFVKALLNKCAPSPSLPPSYHTSLQERSDRQSKYCKECLLCFLCSCWCVTQTHARAPSLPDAGI